MKKSENFGFSLPENSDNCSLDYFNDNFKLIDKNLKQALNPPSAIVLDSIEIKNNNGGTIITCDGMRYYERNYDFEDLVLGTDSLNSNSKYYIKAINIQNPTSEQFGILSANLAVYEYEGEIKSVDDSFILATFETDINALYVEDSLRYFPDSHIYEKINTKADKPYVNNKTAFSLGVAGFYDENNVLIKTFDKLIADGDITVSDGVLTAVSITEQGKLIISDDIIELADGVFSGKSLLIGVKIPDTVTSIPSGAFYRTSLTSITIPDNVTNIGNATFGHCELLTSVTLGKGVTSISDGAFDACNALTDVYYNGDKTDFDNISIGTSNEYLKNAVIHYELTDKVYDEIDTKADKSYVDSLMSAAVKRKIVDILPTTDIDENTIYMLPTEKSKENNIYDEFMYVSGAWEQIGSTAVDLTDYAKKEDVENLIDSLIKNNVQGSPIMLNEHFKLPLQNLRFFGKSVQDGTPTVDEPVSISSTSLKTVNVYGGNVIDISKSPSASTRNIQVDVNGDKITFTALASGQYRQIGYEIRDINLFKDKIYISYNVVNNPNNFKQSFIFRCYDKSNTQLINKTVSNNTTTAITVPKETTYIKIIICMNMTEIAEVGDTVTISNLVISPVACEHEQYKTPTTTTFTNSVTLRGLPVTSGGNITIDGEQYLSDYIDVKSGKLIRNVGIIESYNGEEITTGYLSTTGELSTGATVLYALDSPTTEDLPEEDIAKLQAVQSYYPNSIITSNAEMVIDYVADTKKYIDNQYSKLATAITALGGTI